MFTTALRNDAARHIAAASAHRHQPRVRTHTSIVSYTWSDADGTPRSSRTTTQDVTATCKNITDVGGTITAVQHQGA